MVLVTFAWAPATVALVPLAPLAGRWLCDETPGWREAGEARAISRIFMGIGVLVAALGVVFASWGAEVWDVVAMGAGALFCATVVLTLRPYATSSR